MLSASEQRGKKSLYEYPMGRHNLDLLVDPWRSGRSFSLTGFVELGAGDRSLHQTCSFGKPRVDPWRSIALLLRTMGRVVKVTRIPKKKQPAPGP